jgi:1-acyl-sn-glycerol-3-phosphate acyltransferase
VAPKPRPTMSDVFYEIIRLIGRHPFWVSSRPLVIGDEHTRRGSAFLIAANHQSPFDVPLIIRHARRRVDFVSIREVFEKPFLGTFYGAMNAFPLDRSRRDPRTIRIILDRLARGRVVGMFPEGGFRKGAANVVHSRQIRPGIGRIAVLANVPVVPCVIVGAGQYARWTNWVPWRRVRYGIIFGEPIVGGDADAIEATLVDRLVSLHHELATRLGEGVPNAPN